MWELIKEVTADVYAISAVCWVLVHLILIKLQGTIQIYEPNEWILWIEIIYTGGALILLIERLVKDVRNGKPIR